MEKLSTERALQLHNLNDDLSSRASVALRAADKAASINNFKAQAYFLVRAIRFQSIAEACARRLEVAA
jgi:hypothetical protein